MLLLVPGAGVVKLVCLVQELCAEVDELENVDRETEDTDRFHFDIKPRR